MAVMLSAIFFIGVLFTQCKKDKSQLGLNVQPQTDQIGLTTVDTISLITYTAPSDSIVTDELTAAMLLGSYVDPFFGIVKSSLYTQIRLEGSVDFTPDGGTLADLAVDSVILYLAINSGYGNLEPQTFEVYRMAESIYLDSTYYSNTSKAVMGADLVSAGEGTIIPNPNVPGYVNGVLTSESILRIPLSVNDFAMPIINESGTGVLDANDGDGNFVDWFKGILITSNTVSQSINQGAILYTDPLSANSKVTIYYRDNSGLPSEYDTIQFDLNINSSCARYTKFEQDYTGTMVESQLLDSTEGQDVFFLQTMGGVRSKIALPHIADLLDSSNMVINKAELVLPVQYFPSDAYVPSEELFLVRTLESGGISFIPDYNDDRGGNYTESSSSYTFNITRYLNQMIAGDYENLPLTIVSGGNAVTANRVVFNGPNTILKDKPKLIITYSKYE
jgi:hypothetical protein